MKVLVAEKICDAGRAVLSKGGLEVDYKPVITREELLETIGDYDGLIVRSLPVVDQELYDHATKLKVVGRAGNGVDNIDMEGATNQGIIVVNTPDANSVSACELTIGMMLTSSRNIPQANASLKSGVWGRSRFQGSELMGKTLGIIGLGRIGTLVAIRMNAFGMKVIAYDPYIQDANFQKVHAKKCNTLDELLVEADVITIHTPKTEETFDMIGEQEIAKMKQGVRLINCARGGLINEYALAKALEREHVASAACDVLVQEPCTESPLYQFDNFTVTPHIGATTDEAQENVGISVATEVLAALHGEMVPNAVNLPVLKREDLETIQPYLKLGEFLGKFYHQLEKDPVVKVEVNFCGAAAHIEKDVVTLAVLKGLFEPILKEQVNYVNAKIVAERRGIAVMESTEATIANYLELLRVRVYTANNVFQYAGFTSAGGDIRVTEINGYSFDLHPEKYMIVSENTDTPGIVGSVGTVLGANKVNINVMQLSRNIKEGKAMMIMTVDAEAHKEEIAALNQLEGILKVNFIKL